MLNVIATDAIKLKLLLINTVSHSHHLYNILHTLTDLRAGTQYLGLCLTIINDQGKDKPQEVECAHAGPPGRSDPCWL